jgi:hypothetical protein
MPDLTVTGARTSGRAAARLGPGDIDIVELYDAYTPSHSTRSFSARSRLLPERGAGPFVSHGHFEPGAVCRSTPMVVASLTPSRRMCGSFLLIEAVRQLRPEGGAGQIADCETAIAHGNGGVLSSQRTVILGT